MLFITLLVAIGLQRFLNIASAPYRFEWVSSYYQWSAAKIDPVTKGHGLLALAILVVPVLLVMSILTALAFHLFGTVGYWVLNAALFWYCIDARDLKKSNATSPMGALNASYHDLFALMFWFALFGPIGLILYYVLHHFRFYFASTNNAASTSLQLFSEKTTTVLDWIPIRLFCLSFALVGHFPLVFKEWLKTAFSLDSNTGMIDQCAAPVVSTQEDAAKLIDRSLLVWLIVIALITVGILIS